MKRAFIVHGWDGAPDEGVFPWLKEQLEERRFEVHVPAMPDPLHPRIETWVPYLAGRVGSFDEETFFVGHSIGAQTVLRYLASLHEDSRVGGAVFLAGWLNLTDAAYEDEDDRDIGRPWRETPIDWERARHVVKRFVAIFSDDDPLVPLSDKELFRERLGAEIVVEHGKGHFSGSSGITELASLLEAVLRISG